MVEEQEKKDLDIIDKAHLAAERIEQANRIKEELIKREEEVIRKAEGLRLLGGESMAGTPAPREMTEEEKLHQSLKAKWKGTALDGLFK